MIIDARTQKLAEVLGQLKDLFPAHDNEANPLEVIVRDKKEAGDVRAFASMSGFRTALYHETGHYRVVITGTSCGCNR